LSCLIVFIDVQSWCLQSLKLLLPEYLPHLITLTHLTL
jgi:hypothetical protein